MTSNLASDTCPICGGELKPDNLATIPFILEPDIVIVIKAVPAEICDNCHEPFVAGRAVDRVTALLGQLKALHSELSVVTYTEPIAA